MTGSLSHELIDRLARLRTVMIVGAMDTGKSTGAKTVARRALELGRTVAYVDADTGNPTIGPPACAALKLVRDPSDIDNLDDADRLHFVGGISPDRLISQHVIATAALATASRDLADLVVIDTTGAVSGVVGETLKYHKVELIRPEVVVAFQRGSEMEPIVGMLHRFFSVEVITAPADSNVMPSSPDERAARRAMRFKREFAAPLDRWRVRPTVFAPTLPVGLDLGRLDGVLVGIQDGEGRCLGLGRLEYHDDTLRVLTRIGEGMQGLRLGSLRIDLDTFGVKPINLRELIFGIP